MKNSKFKISGKTIFNILVLGIMIFLVIYFFASEDGLAELLSNPDNYSVFWLLVACAVHNFNIVIDGFVTLIMLRTEYPNFKLKDAIKIAFVGNFFGAITPSSTGGQPMQLYLASKLGVRVGYGSACLTQKFTVFQILSTLISLVAVFLRFEYFSLVLTDFRAILFFLFGFLTQLLATALFLALSFSPRITNLLMKVLFKILNKLKFLKNREALMQKISAEVSVFHNGNKEISKNKKNMVWVYLLVFLQITATLAAPYFIYISFGMPDIALAAGKMPANIIDFICLQAFVTFTSNLVPLPGASGGAELAFTMYFSMFFVVGTVNKIKPAILLWRFVGYYASIVISYPFTYFSKVSKKSKPQEE